MVFFNTRKNKAGSSSQARREAGQEGSVGRGLVSPPPGTMSLTSSSTTRPRRSPFLTWTHVKRKSKNQEYLKKRDGPAFTGARNDDHHTTATNSNTTKPPVPSVVVSPAPPSPVMRSLAVISELQSGHEEYVDDSFEVALAGTYYDGMEKENQHNAGPARRKRPLLSFRQEGDLRRRLFASKEASPTSNKNKTKKEDYLKRADAAVAAAFGDELDPSFFEAPDDETDENETKTAFSYQALSSPDRSTVTNSTNNDAAGLSVSNNNNSIQREVHVLRLAGTTSTATRTVTPSPVEEEPDDNPSNVTGEPPRLVLQRQEMRENSSSATIDKRPLHNANTTWQQNVGAAIVTPTRDARVGEGGNIGIPHDAQDDLILQCTTKRTQQHEASPFRQRLMRALRCHDDNNDNNSIINMGSTYITVMDMFYDKVLVCSDQSNRHRQEQRRKGQESRPFYDEAFTSAFLRQIMTGMMVLYLQPSNDDDWHGHSVCLMIEPTSHESGQPRLEWTTIPGGQCYDAVTTSVSLLAIHKIDDHREQEQQLDDDVTSTFFTVTTNQGHVHMFEANSTQDRDTIVQGLKNIIARLSFHLVVGDATATSELVHLDVPPPSHGKNVESGELPQLGKPHQTMNRIAHAFLDGDD